MTDTVSQVSNGIFSELIATIIGALVFLVLFGLSPSILHEMFRYIPKAQKAGKKTLCIRKIGYEQGSDQE